MISPTKRRILLVVALIAIVLLVIALLWMFLRPKPQAPVPTTPDTTVQPVEQTEPTATQIRDQQEQLQRTQAADVISLSKLFVARYGSFSNDAKFANVTDVLPLMSAAFAQTSQNDLAQRVAPDTFYGVTTRVISVHVESTDETAGASTVRVTTQRTEEKDTAQNTSVKYQDIVLTFLKEGGVWKINSAVWQ